MILGCRTAAASRVGGALVLIALVLGSAGVLSANARQAVAEQAVPMPPDWYVICDKPSYTAYIETPAGVPTLRGYSRAPQVIWYRPYAVAIDWRTMTESVVSSSEWFRQKVKWGRSTLSNQWLRPDGQVGIWRSTWNVPWGWGQPVYQIRYDMSWKQSGRWIHYEQGRHQPHKTWKGLTWRTGSECANAGINPP
jgi:hypothetical protein